MKMKSYSAQSRDQIYLIGYGFLSFPKNMSKIISKNKSKKLSNKYSQKLFDHTKRSATHALKAASKKKEFKDQEPTGDLICNLIANKITKVSRYSTQNTSATVEYETEIPKERYISSKKKDFY